MRCLTYAVLGILLSGCGASLVQAPRRPLVPVELQKFPRQDWRLANNKFFLWRDNLTPEVVSEAQKIAKRIDQLDTDALPLVRRMAELSATIDPLKETQRLLSTHARNAKNAHEKAKKRAADIDAAKAAAQTALDAELAQPMPDADRVTSLKATLAQATAESALCQDQVKELGTLREKLEKDLKNIDKQLAPLVTELSEVEAKQLAIETEGREKVDAITNLVDWYKNQPTSVTFQFQPDGKIASQISDWDLNDDAGVRTFSTEPGPGGKPTITDVAYEPKGGVFTFDVHVYTDDAQTTKRETYSFKIARINYDTRDGRCFFGGDIVQKKFLPDGKTQTRRGIAKLVDRNN